MIKMFCFAKRKKMKQKPRPFQLKAGALKQLFLGKETIQLPLSGPKLLPFFPLLSYTFSKSFKTEEAENDSFYLPWVLDSGPANPSEELQDSLRGDVIGVSASGVSKLPSESELPRGKNEELPLSTVFPRPIKINIATKVQVRHF
jgi:hypothetical protein